MSSKGVRQTQEHKDNIGKSNKGIHLNKTNAGVLILKDGKKLCCVCEEWKEPAFFGKRNDRPIGIRSKCKTCETDSAVIYRQNDIKKYRLSTYVNGAKRRGFSFNLTKDEFLTFWQKPCFYCGDEIQTIGLDRINSNEGYSIGNVVSCCAICNTMKLAIPRDIFIAHCYKIVNNQN